MVEEGLAVLDPTKGIQFDSAASHEDIVEWLLELLPLPFTYLAHVQQETNDGDPAWRVATALRNKLVIAPSSHPDGAVLDYNKGNATTNWKNHQIFIGTFWFNFFPTVDSEHPLHSPSSAHSC